MHRHSCWASHEQSHIRYQTNFVRGCFLEIVQLLEILQMQGVLILRLLNIFHFSMSSRQLSFFNIFRLKTPEHTKTSLRFWADNVQILQLWTKHWQWHSQHLVCRWDWFHFENGGLWSVFIAFMTYDKGDRSSSTPTPHLFLTFLSFQALIDFEWNPSLRLKLYQGTRRSRTVLQI